MFCSKCSTEAAQGGLFCSHCGSSLTAGQPVPVPGASLSPPSSGAGPYEQLEARVAAIERRLPNSNIISKKFWSRAFAVLGHNLAAVLSIYAVIFVIGLLFMALAAIIQAVAK